MVQYGDPGLTKARSNDHLFRAKVVARAGGREIVTEKERIVRTHGWREMRWQPGDLAGKTAAGGDAQKYCRNYVPFDIWRPDSAED